MINSNDQLILSIDLGTSNIKGAIYNLDGVEIAFKSIEYDLFTPSKDIVENDVRKYWKALKNIIHCLILEVRGRVDNIIAVSTTSQGETIVPVDKKGEPLCNAIVWLDSRTKKEAVEISKDFDQYKMFTLTGNPEVSPSWPATRIKWFKKNKPEIFVKTYKFLIIEDYIAFKLTGNYFGEASVYNSSFYYDFVNSKYIEPMLSYLDITPEKLPEIVRPGTCIGNITEEASKQTGLNTRTKVIMGAMDQICGAIGSGNIEKGLISETTGTAFAMVVSIAKPIFDKKTSLPCYLHGIPNLYTLLPYSFTGGMVLKWFKDNFFQTESLEKNIDIYDILTGLAQKVPPGSEGLIMLPHLAGAYFPEYNSNARGVFFGIGLNHTRGHFIRAIMESLGYMMRSNLESLNSLGIKPKRILSIGGGAKSSLWCQMKSDITGIRIEVPEYTETALFGAAILAIVNLKKYNSIEEVCSKFIKLKSVYNPNIKNKSIYDNVYKKYKNLYKNLESQF